MSAFRCRRWVAAAGGIAVLPLALSACGGSTPASRSTTSSTTQARATDRSVCGLVTPARVTAIMDTPVRAATAVNRGSATTCTYRAPDPAQSVIVEFQGGATTSSYESGQQAFELRYGPTTPVSGLGSAAYEATTTSEGQRTDTVVTLVGSTQVVVIGTNSVAQVERLTEEVLDALYARSPRGSTATSAPTTTSTSPATG
jgi:hypothetical protein